MPDNMNPLDGIMDDFEKIINRIIIKYMAEAESYETLEIQKYADMYLSAYEKSDDFFTYRDYSTEEYNAVGLPEVYIHMIPRDGIACIPIEYREKLLENRRKQILIDYEEKNEYYRKYNGLPPLENQGLVFYVPEEYATKLNITANVPIHRLQDYYNNIQKGLGDQIISNVEAYGIIDNLKERYPDLEYLNFLGRKRISIYTARKARNFQIIYLNQGELKNNIYDTFIEVYEQCRDYFISVIYNTQFRSFIEYYDNFIAMCIMLMTITQVINRQLPRVIDREFFTTTGLRMFYDAYNVPYNANIDDYTQKAVAQSLNLLIQRKSTDKVLIDIAKLLGYIDINIYKYYLTREQKFDRYGVPVVKYREVFNNDTGEMETVPDYNAMYDVYFQKVPIGEEDYIESFKENVNREEYRRVVSEDPFWWEDTNLEKSVWETSYNIIESKYLSLAISYKMTDIMYENVLLLKMLISKSEEISTIKFTIPKIAGDLEINLFDAVILLCCLTAKKHHLKGEIISIPSQVLSVLDFLHNTDGGSEYLLDSFAFDFDFFKPDNQEGQEQIIELAGLLLKQDEKDAEHFLSYIKSLNENSNATEDEKIEALNNLFTTIKGLSAFLNYMMSKTKDRKTYNTLKQFYKTVYYSKEIKDIFTINEDDPTLKRTAKTYFEFLYYHNPAIYNILFTVDFEQQYQDFLKANNLIDVQFPYSHFLYEAQYCSIDIRYSDLNTTNEDIRVHEDLIYYYIDHIITRMETVIKNLRFIYLLNDTTSTALENLLIKLINFFKSFTVDMLGLDVLYICNLKAENVMRLFDEIHYMRKIIQAPDNLKLQYSDIDHKHILSIHQEDRQGYRDDLCDEGEIKIKETMQLQDRIKKTWRED